MDNDRVSLLGEDIRLYVFETLDQEIELTGDDAGKVAAAVEEAFLKALRDVLEEEKAPEGWDHI